MAEQLDPFEAAMAALNGDKKAGDDKGLQLDDLEAALKEDLSAGEGDAGATSSADPFDIAKSAMEGGDTEADGSGDSDSVDPFETAMAAMDAVSSDDVSLDQVSGEGATSDPFQSALEITKKADRVPATKPKETVFEGQEIDIDFLMDIKMTITFEVGRTKMFISDLLSLGQGSVIELHRLVGEELDLFINGELLATGEVVVVNEKFGARIVKILTPEDRLNRLAPTLKK
ncbi:flagellar motor switch protein FliN [bacterium]|nr:flagellar motor switch protein FliN [bacterium]